ncbi:hypothetical protein LWU65_09590 [Enterobacter hormaechei]|nr:hypothetical protein [Enterobacter hormaechei]
MDELAKKVQEKYIEDLTSRYPLHRFLILFMVIFFMLTYQKGNVDIYNILNQTSLKEVFDFQGGVLSGLSMLQLMQALIISLILNSSHKKLNFSIFNQLVLKGNSNGYIEKLHEKYKNLKRNDAYDFFLIKEIDKKIADQKASLRVKVINSEIMFSLLFCIIWSFHLSAINTLSILSLLLLWFYAQWDIYKFYTSDFFPLYVAKQSLQDEPIVATEGFHD